MGQATPIHTHNLESFEELNDAIPGTQREFVQLERGRVRGHLTHLSVGDMPVDVGAFSIGMRSRGVISGDRVVIGMLTGSDDRVTQWSRDMHPGDVTITLPGGEQDGRYYGGASFAAISVSPDDLHSFLAGDARIQNLNSAHQNFFPAADQFRDRLLSRLNGILRYLRDSNVSLTTDAAQFWRRSIIEAMIAPVLLQIPVDSDDPPPSGLKIVRKVEEYLDRTATPAIHISEICDNLNISRRTLHRAFHDALGMGPVAFLQRRRLCSVHSVLRRGDPATTTIAEVALQHGFQNLGRFSGYYRALFDEYPSETLGHSTAPL